MTRNRVPLGNYVTEYSVRNKDNEDIPVYSVTNSQGFCREYFGKEVASKDKTTYKIVPYGYFAYNPSRINVGSVDWQRCEAQVIVSPLYNVFSVSDELDRQFLYYFLKSNIGRQMIRAKAAGSVRDNLKLDMLKEMTIPDISLDDQRLCVATLDNLQYLIELRKKQLNKLDELVKARFVELFGDIHEPSKWEKKPWSEVVTIQNGRDYKKILVESGGYPVYGTGGEMARVSEYLCPENTIIVGRKGTINNPLLVKEKFWNVDTAFGVIVGNKLHYQYFYNFCKMFDFSTLNKQAVLPSTTKADLLKIEIAVPPMELQNQFASFVEQVDKSKFTNFLYLLNVMFYNVSRGIFYGG